jgi:nitroreductase
MDVHEAIRGRYTADAFSEEAPPRDLVERLIETSIWAPNHRLTEPWRFAVVAGDERERMGDALAEWLLSDANPNTPDEDEVAMIRGSMARSPVTVVVVQCGTPDDSAVRNLEDYAACCCVTQNLMLAAHAEGLTSKWVTGRLTGYPVAKDLLGAGEHDRIVGYVRLGYPAEGADAPERTRTPPSIDWRGM